MKRCTRCGEVKEDAAFSRARVGLRPRCRVCRQLDYKEYMLDEKNVALRKEYHRQWYQENRDRINDYSREWIRANPEKRRATIRRVQARRNSRMRNLPATLTEEEWQTTLSIFGHSCAYCGTKSCNLHQEHFIPVVMGGGYEAGNILPACPACNHAKKDKSPLEFLGLPKYEEILTRIHSA